jgi:hypothetical protein
MRNPGIMPSRLVAVTPDQWVLRLPGSILRLLDVLVRRRHPAAGWRLVSAAVLVFLHSHHLCPVQRTFHSASKHCPAARVAVCLTRTDSSKHQWPGG